MKSITSASSEAGGGNIFIELNGVSVGFAQRFILKDISLDIYRGKHLAITGPSGSGKTSLLKLLAGQLHMSSGVIKIYTDIPMEFGSRPWKESVAFVDIKHHFRSSDGVTGFYYQQRFNAGDGSDQETVAEYLKDLMIRHSVKPEEIDHLNEYLQLNRLHNRSLIQLSSGETRRLLITAALLRHPELLLLENPYTGLDAEGRAAFNRLLHDLSANNCTVVMTTGHSQIPERVHAVYNMNDGNIRPGKSSGYSSEISVNIDREKLHNLIGKNPLKYSSIVQMKDIVIRYGDIVILNELNWEVKPGEKWALIGQNGSGKSTLLSLINADHPQAYANNIVLFDRKRGTGESIWDIKKNTGFLSAELYQYFPQDQSCLQVIASGYYDTIGLFRMISTEQRNEIQQWLDLLNITAFSNKLFMLVPAGIQRMVLLIRAMIKRPPLLLLDEPAHGLDELQKQQLKMLVEEICRHPEITLIYVTHQYTELPSGVTRVLRLTRNTPAETMKINELQLEN